MLEYIVGRMTAVYQEEVNSLHQLAEDFRYGQYLLAPNTSTVDPLSITLTLSIRDENKILELIYEE